jgi:hypothetical protein
MNLIGEEVSRKNQMTVLAIPNTHALQLLEHHRHFSILRISENPLVGFHVEVNKQRDRLLYLR